MAVKVQSLNHWTTRESPLWIEWWLDYPFILSKQFCFHYTNNSCGNNWGKMVQRSFPGGSVVKNLPADTGDAGEEGLTHGLGRSPGVGYGNSLQYSCLKKSHGQRNLMGCSLWGCIELHMTEHACTHSAEPKIYITHSPNSQSILCDCLIFLVWYTYACTHIYLSQMELSKMCILYADVFHLV